MTKTNWQKYKLLREAADINNMDSISPGAMALGYKMAARTKQGTAAAPTTPMTNQAPTDGGAALGNKMQKQVIQQIAATMSAKLGTGMNPAMLRGGMRRDMVANLIGPELFKKAQRMGVLQIQGDMVNFSV